MTKQSVLRKCGNLPWLIEPEQEPASFLFLKTKGYVMTENRWQLETQKCSTNSRIIIYSGFDPRNPKVICPINSRDANSVQIIEIFSDGWNGSLQRISSIDPKSRSFVVEFVNTELEGATYAVSWLEVSKRLLHSTSSLVIECPFR